MPEIFKILIKVLEVKHLGWKRISETATLGEKKERSYEYVEYRVANYSSGLSVGNTFRHSCM